MRLLFRIAVLGVCVSWSGGLVADQIPIHIYIDADYSNHFESSQSIERGLQVALSKVDYTLMGRPVKLIRKDHRGNSARSLRHIKQYLKDPNALLIVPGIHSPPLLAHREFINDNDVLVLVPWAAAGPITRAASSKNSIFRLSIDDTKAGKVIASFAVNEKGYSRPFLMLERTGWGRSNERTMSTALKDLGVSDFHVGWFDWNLKEAGAQALIEEALVSRSDSIFLVGNSIEGSTIARVLAEQSADRRLPMLSHWGITGGAFHEKVTNEMREAIDLHFIQTSFSFVDRELDDYEQDVFSRAKAQFSDVKTVEDIAAPTGFIHAHDLGVLLSEAANSLGGDLTVERARTKLRHELQEITGPVRGLIKIYSKPFAHYTPSKPDAHEALQIGDFVMGYYGQSDEIVLHEWRGE